MITLLLPTVPAPSQAAAASSKLGTRSSTTSYIAAHFSAHRGSRGVHMSDLTEETRIHYRTASKEPQERPLARTQSPHHPSSQSPFSPASPVSLMFPPVLKPVHLAAS
ncbi:hypothetical protein DPEC_G00263110 [Dallia pectoralis]|uniref:Uncharacterized protein n=1 Tax=Dallia pectoralis TaxID=75939 RepID=A0ACC2FSA1_DALPE|nr:hypothetical protein DPEC_G00263110 [Dallia pectoralis]